MADGTLCMLAYTCADEAPIPEPMITETTPSHGPHDITGGSFGFKLVGDNIDFTVKARYMHTDGRQDQSLHYYHAYAIRDRIDLSRLPFTNSPRIACPTDSSMIRSMALEMLPSSVDNAALSKNISILVSRVLVDNLPFFKEAFSDVVMWHIEHKHSDEMCRKSEVVSVFLSMVLLEIVTDAE